MIIGGLQKISLLDYPEHVAAIIFTQGCNFRCQFCYNPMLVWPTKIAKKKYNQDHTLIPENDLFNFLKARQGKLEAVVITGGEPTLHKDLPEFIKKIKQLGFLVKLDTNGTSPEMLKKIIKAKLVDYLAMDFKAPWELYDKITGVKAPIIKIKQSLKIIMSSGLPYEFRTTVVPGLLKLSDLEKMAKILKGADKWFLQRFKDDIDLVNQALKKTIKGRQQTELDLETAVITAKNFVKFVSLR